MENNQQLQEIFKNSHCIINNNVISLYVNENLVSEMEDFGNSEEDQWFSFEYEEQLYDLNTFFDSKMDELTVCVYTCYTDSDGFVQTNTDNWVSINVQ